MSRPSAPSSSTEFHGLSPAATLAMLVGLSLPLFFVKLGGAGLVDPDEPYYAVPALEMLKSGTWAVPVFRGQPWFDKPVLFYWMILAAFKTFGVSEWAARCGSALAGLGGVLALATMAPAAWRRDGTSVLAAIVLASSLEYAFLSRSAVTDMTLTLFLTLGFLAVARYLESGALSSAAAAGAAFGLATLTKGPVGVLLPGVALLLYAVATRRRELFAWKPIATAAAAFAITALPWYAYMIVAHRDLVVHVFLGEENLGRFVNPEHRQLPLFYVAVFAVGMLPWSAALPAGLIRAVRSTWRREERTGTSPGMVFALAWFVSVVGVFSLSASKLLTYVLPAFPAAAFLIARYWSDAFTHREDHRAGRGPKLTAVGGAAIAVLSAIAIAIAARGGRYAIAGPAAYGLAFALAAAGIAAVAAVHLGRMRTFVAVQAASTVAVVLVFVLWAWPALEASESTRTLVSRLRELGVADQVAGAYHVPDVSLDFYLDRTLLRETEAGGLARRVASEPGRLWVVRADEVDAMAKLPFDLERLVTVSRRSVVRLSPGSREGA